MVANRKDNLLSQFSRWSPDDGSTPSPGVCTGAVDSTAVSGLLLSKLFAVPLFCSSFSSIRSKLVNLDRAEPVAAPEAFGVDPCVMIGRDWEAFKQEYSKISWLNQSTSASSLYSVALSHTFSLPLFELCGIQDCMGEIKMKFDMHFFSIQISLIRTKLILNLFWLRKFSNTSHMDSAEAAGNRQSNNYWKTWPEWFAIKFLLTLIVFARASHFFNPTAHSYSPTSKQLECKAALWVPLSFSLMHKLNGEVHRIDCLFVHSAWKEKRSVFEERRRKEYKHPPTIILIKKKGGGEEGNFVSDCVCSLYPEPNLSLHVILQL